MSDRLCPHCDKSFTRPHDLRRHVANKHKDAGRYGGDDDEEDDKSVICSSPADTATVDAEAGDTDKEAEGKQEDDEDEDEDDVDEDEDETAVIWRHYIRAALESDVIAKIPRDDLAKGLGFAAFLKELASSVTEDVRRVEALLEDPTYIKIMDKTGALEDTGMTDTRARGMVRPSTAFLFPPGSTCNTFPGLEERPSGVEDQTP
jgi:hypothetical protein